MGLSKTANTSIFIPIVATSKYKKRLPYLDAPIPSISRTGVNDKIMEIVVVIMINQKKLDVRLNLERYGAFLLIKGAITSPRKCANPDIPNATATN